ncbi:MAG: hypothetical protein KF832_30610 [Caldilineaceae bacterium]|nr:hypothetical protein [Caldilineaceae bacterium]
MYLHRTPNQLRIALYSHDTQGLGHIRRNVAIAEALAAGLDQPAILLISGAQVAGAFDLPPGTDCLTVPALGKTPTGQYHARSLGVSLNRLVELRATMIQAALTAFDPDVLIVDKVPQGALDELLPALQVLKATGKTRCILGLRDILDDPVTTRHEWVKSNSDHLIRTYYDALWVYGDPTVYDAVTEYDWAPDIAAKVAYTGYLNRLQTRTEPLDRNPTLLDALQVHDRRLVLCAVGGGQDGYPVAHAFAQTPLPADTVGVLLTGPYMPAAQRAELQALAQQQANLHLINFTTDPAPLYQRADAVIAMGGYNTTCEILAAQKHALLVPRVTPRLEQWIRAQRLHELGVLDIVHPDHLSPARIAHWLHQRPRPLASRCPIDLDGLTRLPHLLTNLVTDAPRPAQPTYPTLHPMMENHYGNHNRTTPRRVPAQNVPALL